MANEEISESLDNQTELESTLQEQGLAGEFLQPDRGVRIQPAGAVRRFPGGDAEAGAAADEPGADLPGTHRGDRGPDHRGDFGFGQGDDVCRAVGRQPMTASG